MKSKYYMKVNGVINKIWIGLKGDINIQNETFYSVTLYLVQPFMYSTKQVAQDPKTSEG